ncbi:MAG: hypothetical protein [Bacteriophage sp.]|nr:MAG: hypothetical protein [Bacteriophage sp.]
MSLKDIDQGKLVVAVNSALGVLSVGTTAVALVKDIATATVNFYTAFTSDSGISGADKKSIVLSLLEQTWSEFVTSNAVFSDWAVKISQFIDSFHASYKSLVNNLTTLRNILFGDDNAKVPTNITI